PLPQRGGLPQGAADSDGRPPANTAVRSARRGRSPAGSTTSIPATTAAAGQGAAAYASAVTTPAAPTPPAAAGSRGGDTRRRPWRGRRRGRAGGDPGGADTDHANNERRHRPGARARGRVCFAAVPDRGHRPASGGYERRRDSERAPPRVRGRRADAVSGRAHHAKLASRAGGWKLDRKRCCGRPAHIHRTDSGLYQHPHHPV
ncbi:MAG: hypothetical protein AVDCRST_MAG26-3394, partial [uncultured Chloroflexia bacterium]